MLSLYRAWLPAPGFYGFPRPAPPPGAHRPIPRRPEPNVPQRAPSPTPTDTSSEVDVENVEERERTPNVVLDVACCDGPVRFSRVLNSNWREPDAWSCTRCRHASKCTKRHATHPQYYPCKTCGSKFPSYYFVHKHRKICHAEEETARTSRMDAQDQPAQAP